MTAVTTVDTARSLPRGITRRGNRYIVRLNVGVDAGGKRVRHYYTCNNETEAKAKLRQIVRRKEDGENTVLSRLTLGQWCDEYTTRWCLEKRPRTRRDLALQFSLRLPPVLRATRLRALSPSLLQTWVADLVEQGLGPRSVAMAHAAVRAALNVAVRQGKLTRNPAAHCVLPPKEHRERARLTTEQATAFLSVAQSDPLYPFFVVALNTACRPAEVFGLQWGDLRGDILSVRRSVVIGESGHRELADTKTGRERQVPLSGSVLAVLKRHRFRLGSPADDTLMFPSDTGTPLDGRNVANRHLKPLLKQAQLPPMRLYDLRHSALSILADQQVDPKIIQELAGHSKIQTTYDTYIHSRPEQKRAAVVHLGQLVAATA